VAELPLSGLRVVEVSSFVAAPLGGMTLAQLGADVVRIDPLGGAADVNRWPLHRGSGASLYWLGLNQGKQSMTLNLRSEEGQRIVARLLEQSGPHGGILLTNSLDRSALDYETLSQARRDLIHVQVLGRHDGTPAVDYTVNAATGFPLITGPVNGAEPVNHVLPAWDVACGLYAALAIVSAERQRSRTGEGQRISIALEDVALAMAGNLGFLAEAQLNKVARQRLGNYLYGSFGRDFTCRDGARVMVVALTARQWTDLVWVTDQREPIVALESTLGRDFRQEGDRFTYRHMLCGLLEHWFAERDGHQVHEALRGTSVLWAPYRSFLDLVSPGGPLDDNPMLSIVDQPGVGSYLAPGSPVRTAAAAPACPAPTLGEHTRPVLQQELGLDDDAVAALQAAGIIDAPSSEV
jgi:2-methylfumaryl-CoA isomerase